MDGENFKNFIIAHGYIIQLVVGVPLPLYMVIVFFGCVIFGCPGITPGIGVYILGE